MLEQQLRAHTSAEIRFDAPTRLIYSTDASNYKIMPLGVALPRTHEDIVAIVSLCAEQGVPVVPRGGGSGLAGQSIGPGVVIDTTKYMDALLDIDVASRSARVQTGLVLGQLNKKLAAHGLQFGPDPASAERAAVGGVIGTNATGSHSIRYGMTADNVNALRCVLADGRTISAECQVLGAPGLSTQHSALSTQIAQIVSSTRSAIYRDYPKVWRRSSGYNIDFIAEMLDYDAAAPTAALTPANARRRGSNLDNHLRQISRFNLAPLIAGSEGTLAVVSEATLNLFPKPKFTAVAITSFVSLLDAMRAIPDLLALDPSAIELIGGLFIKLARDLPECRGRLGWLDVSAGIPDGLLVIEFDGASAAEAEAGVARLEALIARAGLACTVKVLRDARAQADVWYVRKIGLNVLASIRSDFKPISVVEDVAVPVEHLADYVQRLSAVFKSHNTEGAFYAHASAGVLHVRPLINLKTIDGVRAMRDIGEQAFALCRELGGAMTGEHGDGYERSHWNRGLFGEEIYQAFVAVKRAFDPRGLLNPNKKVDALQEDALETMMRLGPAYRSKPFASTFAFHTDGSLAGMAEQCNGSGVCRKSEGVMCPSYRATRDEMHSTRGRANLLRAFLTESPEFQAGSGASALPPQDSGLGSRNSEISVSDVQAALDLCVSCKACESECASGVDMAKMKSDFLQQVYDKEGVPLRALVFGRIAALSALAAPVAPLANWALGLSVVKRALGVAPDRPLPEFASQTFDAWWRKQPVSVGRHSANQRSPQSPVVLYVDTFTRYNHPQVGIAAVRVLRALGKQVIVPPARCCGRPLISQGQPRAAQAYARRVVGALAPFARAGIPIVGLEPSCISAIKDDYIDLIGAKASADDDGADSVRAVARATHAVEDWLAEQDLGALSTGANTRAPLLLHGHCHQKALWGTGGTKRVLDKLGYALTEIDSTCCGMAGAFGYEAEHAETSRKIGELALLPAVRNAPPDARVLAGGTSCREQITHLAARQVRHPIEVIAESLDAALS